VTWAVALAVGVTMLLVAREAVLEVQAWRARRNAVRLPEQSNVVELRPKARREA
jgi:hypothetical protein